MDYYQALPAALRTHSPSAPFKLHAELMNSAADYIEGLERKVAMRDALARTVVTQAYTIRNLRDDLRCMSERFYFVLRSRALGMLRGARK